MLAVTVGGLDQSVFVDASYADNEVDRRSTTGSAVTVRGTVVCAFTKTQPVTAQSTSEAEYVAAGEGVVLEDSRGALALIENSFSSARSKHIDVRFHFIRDLFKSVKITAEYVPTGEQHADMLTNVLGREKGALALIENSFSSARSKHIDVRFHFIRDLFKSVKITAEGQQFVADENGVLLRNRDDILQRWARSFSTLLNTKSPTLNSDIIELVTQRPATRDTQRLEEVPDLEEVARATKGLKNWKAPGHDSLPAELLKIDDDDPFDATIKVLYKKGDRSNCNNYRGISLLQSHVGKVPIKIITNRQSAFCEANNILLEEQCGFRPERSTVEMFFVMRRVQELGRRK
ncbi:unnamed protein product [Ectocarpus sp. CCAP 1310/34]|nr:unnamed protein product [Ectocarpus sp. CCAP 1310/34]